MAFSEEAKDLIFRRAGGKCERCGKQLARNNHFEGEWGAWEAHHRVAVKSGGSDAPSNGEALRLVGPKNVPPLFVLPPAKKSGRLCCVPLLADRRPNMGGRDPV